MAATGPAPAAFAAAAAPRRPSPALALVTALPVAVVAAAAARRLSAVVRSEPGVPLWDEAAQGLVGRQLLDALRAGQLLEFLRLVNDQVVWPFLHGLLLVPWMALAGDDLESAARLAAWLAALTPLAAFAGGLALHPARGVLAGSLAAALIATAPVPAVFGTLGMLEAPGAFLLAVTFALHARALQPGAARGWTAAAGLSTAALVLLKYNYGLLWLAGLLLFEWRDRPPAARRAAREAVERWLGAGGWRRPLPLLAALAALVTLAILVTGGGAFAAFGQRISLRSPGNPAYVLLLLLTAWAAVSSSRRRAAWRDGCRRLGERTRLLALTIGLPLLLWFLIPHPNRVRALVEFSINRSTGPAPWSLEGLLYYPAAFARDYAAAPGLGWAVLALALLPPRRIEPAALRLAWCAALAGLAATTLHRYHDPRFLHTTAVVIALAAAGRLTVLIAMLAARVPPPAGRALAGAALVAALAAPFAAPPGEARIREGHRGYRGAAAILAPADALLDRAAAAGAPGVLLGASTPLSPALLEWRARTRGLPPAIVPRRSRGAADDPARPRFAAMPVPGTGLERRTRDELAADRRAFESLLASGPPPLADTTVGDIRIVHWPPLSR